MVLLFLAMGCGTGEPETAEEWCEVATAATCECPGGDVGATCVPADIPASCASQVAAHTERWGASYALELQQCLAEHPCPEEWEECPAPPE